MIKFLYKINKAYDNLPETRRFLIFMAMAIPGILAMNVTEYREVMVVGWVWILIMLTSRASYMHGWLKSGKPKDE